MSGIPGAFFSDSEGDEGYTDGLPGGLTPTSSDLEDEDFQPESDIHFSDTEDQDDDDDDDEMADEAPVASPNSDDPQGAISIGFDAVTRRVYLIDANGNAQLLTNEHLAGSSLTLASVRAMLLARGVGGRNRRGAQPEEEEDEDEEEEDEEEDDDVNPYWGATRKTTKKWYEPVLEPKAAGILLERSGEFGPSPRSYAAKERKFCDYRPSLPSLLRDREFTVGRTPKSMLGRMALPNSAGVEVAQHEDNVYSGQYSADGNFFYAASKAMKVYIYDTRSAPRTGDKSVLDTPAPVPSRRSMYGTAPWQHRSSMKVMKVIKANRALCQWTVTDATLSADNSMLCYSSITPYLQLAKTGGSGTWESGDDDHEVLDITNGRGSMSRFGVWSVRFSTDAKELVAGANDGQMFVFDLETQRTILRVNAHTDDVNAVAFADTSSSNLLLSGSDDSFIKVWDRRSLSGQRASGTLVGHTEGITFVESKGDGRYCLSNGKDQAMRLWDLRMMVDGSEFEKKGLDRVDYSIPGWDYRQSYYPKPKYREHPHDVSVMVYRGHAVMRTLIRCHFSPAATTDQQYVYSGGSDGKIHIWHLDGRVAQVIDRRYTHPLLNRETGDYNDPASASLRSSAAPPSRGYSRTVRDVSWHPTRPEMMSTAWGDDGVEGSLALHSWHEEGLPAHRAVRPTSTD